MVKRTAFTGAVPGFGLVVLLGGLVMGSAPAAALTEDDISVLSGTCANCHGPDGRSSTSIPSIAGQPAAVLEAQLKAFKAKEIPGTTVMDRHAAGYSDEQIAALARYFSQIKK